MRLKIQLLHFLLGILVMASDMTATPTDQSKDIYGFSFKSIDGTNLPLESFRGKVLLIVNTASKCGFTKQYEGLEKIYLKYKNKGLVILGVPSNDFGGQEPGNEAEIKSFCRVNFGVTFPMTKKEVVSGKDAHPFYIWAKKELGFATAPKWNFHKYLINRQGKLVDYYYSTTRPDTAKVEKAIEKLLE